MVTHATKHIFIRIFASLLFHIPITAITKKDAKMN